MMQPQQQSPIDFFSSIFNAQFFSNLVMFVIMFAWMKVLLIMLEEPAPAAGKLREEAASKAITKEALRENPDWSDKQAVYLELELEYIGGRLENRSLGIGLEAASGITKELLGRQYVDGAYIAEKISRVERAITEPEFKTKLSQSDEALVKEAINGYAELEFTTQFGREAKALVMSVIRQDVATTEYLIKRLSELFKTDQRFA
jgi:hypothetical protein